MSSSRGWIAGGAVAAVVAGLGMAGLAIHEARNAKKKERRERRRQERKKEEERSSGGGGAARPSAGSGEGEAPINWQGVMTPLTEVVRGIRSHDVDTVQQACVVALEQAAHGACSGIWRGLSVPTGM